MNLLKPPLELRRGFKDPKHLAKVAQLPCSLCTHLKRKQTTRTEVHHLHGFGMGKKVSDRLCMPLCSECHRAGEFAFHHIGRVAWEEKFGLTQNQLIELTNIMIGHEA